YRLRGEAHTWTPDTIATLQHAVRLNVPERYREYAALVNRQENQLQTLRGLFRLRSATELGRQPVPVDSVEPASEIVKRFATGAMSYGSISKEAHETLAIALNSFGGRSNSGEGGEEVERFKPLPDGRSRRSAIKQVAS
ncbi:glutamate synthase-related protein, partial [Corallococcus exiguus]|uniref:glutamate synthase-related protein n=1 Tax=Corallococcus exiguus TaxID=83462 RepID=UPI0015611558